MRAKTSIPVYCACFSKAEVSSNLTNSQKNNYSENKSTIKSRDRRRGMSVRILNLVKFECNYLNESN